MRVATLFHPNLCKCVRKLSLLWGVLGLLSVFFITGINGVIPDRTILGLVSVPTRQRMGVAERPHDVQGFPEAYVGIAKTTLATSSATRTNLLVYVYQTFKNCLPCKGRLTCLHFCIELTMKIKTFYNLLYMFQFPNSLAML